MRPPLESRHHGGEWEKIGILVRREFRDTRPSLSPTSSGPASTWPAPGTAAGRFQASGPRCRT
jgi:hypothetical protein